VTTELINIFRTHVSRIGWVRTVSGLLAMLLCILPLILIYFTSILLTFRFLISPIYGVVAPRARDHIINDRHRIVKLNAFDRFNCVFCAYANGTCTLMNTQLDVLTDSRTNNRLAKTLLFPALLFQIVIIILSELCFQIIYNVLVATPLGLHRVSIRKAAQEVRNHNYASQFSYIMRTHLRIHKNQWLRFSYALEQIESSWCPLVHYEKRNGIVYPKHHTRFHTHKTLAQMQKLLRSKGTVSARLPKY